MAYPTIFESGHWKNETNALFSQDFDLQADLINNPAATYFLRVGSDAMQGDGILIGDKVVVDKA